MDTFNDYRFYIGMMSIGMVIPILYLLVYFLVTDKKEYAKFTISKILSMFLCVSIFMISFATLLNSVIYKKGAFQQSVLPSIENNGKKAAKDCSKCNWTLNDKCKIMEGTCTSQFYDADQLIDPLSIYDNDPKKCEENKGNFVPKMKGQCSIPGYATKSGSEEIIDDDEHNTEKKCNSLHKYTDSNKTTQYYNGIWTQLNEPVVKQKPSVCYKSIQQSDQSGQSYESINWKQDYRTLIPGINTKEECETSDDDHRFFPDYNDIIEAPGAPDSFKGECYEYNENVYIDATTKQKCDNAGGIYESCDNEQAYACYNTGNTPLDSFACNKQACSTSDDPGDTEWAFDTKCKNFEKATVCMPTNEFYRKNARRMKFNEIILAIENSKKYQNILATSYSDNEQQQNLGIPVEPEFVMNNSIDKTFYTNGVININNVMKALNKLEKHSDFDSEDYYEPNSKSNVNLTDFNNNPKACRENGGEFLMNGIVRKGGESTIGYTEESKKFFEKPEGIIVIVSIVMVGTGMIGIGGAYAYKRYKNST